MSSWNLTKEIIKENAKVYGVVEGKCALLHVNRQIIKEVIELEQ